MAQEIRKQVKLKTNSWNIFSFTFNCRHTLGDVHKRRVVFLQILNLTHLLICHPLDLSIKIVCLNEDMLLNVIHFQSVNVIENLANLIYRDVTTHSISSFQQSSMMVVVFVESTRLANLNASLLCGERSA